MATEYNGLLGNLCRGGVLDERDDVSLFSQIAGNNLRAVAIHVVAVLFAIGSMFLATNFVILNLATLAAVLAYVVLAYRMIPLLPRNNVLSVAFLPMLLLMLLLGGLFIFDAFTPDAATSAFTVANYPAVYFTFLLSVIPDMIVGNTEPPSYDHIRVMEFVAVFVPSLFMYLGLLLKMRHQKKAAELLAEAGAEEAGIESELSVDADTK